MWYFEAKYYDIIADKTITRNIKFDGDNFLNSEKECYLYAMERAYEMMKENEMLDSIKFLACQNGEYKHVSKTVQTSHYQCGKAVRLQGKRDLTA